jgi:hypothetical protein
MIDISKPEPLSLTHKIHFTWGKPSVSLDEMKLVLSALTDKLVLCKALSLYEEE